MPSGVARSRCCSTSVAIRTSCAVRSARRYARRCPIAECAVDRRGPARRGGRCRRLRRTSLRRALASHADGHDIGTAVIIEEIVDLGRERRVAALVASDVIAVHEHDRVAEHAVELEPDSPALVRGGHVDRRPVPADAVLREFAADRLEAVRRAAVGSLRPPVPAANGSATAQSCGTMTSAQPLSSNLGICGVGRLPGLGEGSLVATEAEVLLDVRGMAEMESPVVQPLAAARLRALLRTSVAAAAMSPRPQTLSATALAPIISRRVSPSIISCGPSRATVSHSPLAQA